MGVQWGRSRWEAVLEKVTRSQVTRSPVERGPPLGPVLVGSGPWWWPTFRVFCRLPTLISYVSNLVWVFRGVVLVFWAFSFEKTPQRFFCHAVSREPRCVFFVTERICAS